jgi:NAD(P)-dependent dehydrogenase (short-subunit alcohol dehydrogenase family)
MAQPNPVSSVLVTGAAGHIGYAVALAFAEAGARVFVNDLTAAAVRRAVKSLTAKSAAEIVGVSGDISRAAEVAAIFQTVAARGGIDALVNCAADLGLDGPALQIPPQRLLRTLEVNVLGTFQACQQAVQAWRRRRRGGVIVNVSSVVAGRAIRGRAGYVASKGGLNALTRALAIEWAPVGIRVCGIAPGFVATDRWKTLSAKVLLRRLGNIPARQPSTPAEVAAVIRFLCSTAAQGISGEVLVMDGGASAQFMPADADL